MPKYEHPSYYAPALKQEYLIDICREILKVVKDALVTASTELDDSWTRGTLIYGRVKGLVRELSRNKNRPWFRLINTSMDFTFAIEGTPIQFVKDNPFNPSKFHRLKPNDIEQLSLLDTDSEMAIWRIFVDQNYDEDFFDLKIYLFGYDAQQQIKCIWQPDTITHIPMLNTDVPPPEDIEDTELSRRFKYNIDEKINNGNAD